MTTNHLVVPDRVKTPELGSREKQTWTQLLLWQSPKRRERRNAHATPPAPISVPTAEEVHARMRQEAQMVDRILNEGDMRDNYEKVINQIGEFSCLDLQPNIQPTDELWKDQFLFFEQEVNAKTIQQILDEHFMEWQRHLLLPPTVPGTILELQTNDTERYKHALSEGFRSVQDNILTKLTMVHFGLPVEPFTLNNVLNAGRDENDPIDAPTAPARVQRIMYFEAPLEFLDGYEKRSYGYPMIRMKSQLHLRGGAGEQGGSILPELCDSDLYDTESESERFLPREVEDEFYLYGRDARVEIEYSRADLFLDAAFKLLHMDGVWDKDGDWNFVVDQYDNSGAAKDLAEKELIGNAIDVNKGNYVNLWENTLRSRVFNPEENWVVVVSMPRNGGSAPATYTLQTASLEEQSVDTPQRGTPSKVSPGPKSKTNIVFCMIFDDDDWHAEEVKVENTYLSFTQEVRAALVPDRGPFNVVLFSRADLNLPPNVWKYHSQKQFNPNYYHEDIYPKLHSTSNDWVVVAIADPSNWDWDYWPLNASTSRWAEETPEEISITQDLSPKTAAPSSNTGYVYGYAGKIRIEKSPAAFKDAVLDLLHLSDSQSWEFELDVINRRGGFFVPVRVTRIEFAARYKFFIDKQLVGQEWPVFVRRILEAPPASLEPDKTAMNVIKLTHDERGTAYWKLPRDANQDLGINQLQDDFFRAMQVLFPARLARPATNVLVDGCLLGFGGMEVTEDLLIKFGNYPRNVATEVKVVLDAAADVEPLGIRFACAKNGLSSKVDKTSSDSKAVYRLMNEMVLTTMNPAKLPSLMRVWKTATDRESNTGSVVVPFTPNADVGDELATFLGPSLQGIGTNCLWFRPEFTDNDGSTITTIDRNLPGVFWNIGSRKALADFRGLVKELFRDHGEHAADCFEMVNSGLNLRFVVDVNTSEVQWRKHVFDYLPTTEFQILRKPPLTYAAQKTMPWGNPPETELAGPTSGPQAPNTAATRSVPPESSTSGPASNPNAQTLPQPTTSRPAGPPSGFQSGGNARTRSDRQSASSGVRPLAPFGGPVSRDQAVTKFNKDRILKPTVTQPKPVKWDTSMVEQERQTNLKNKSFTQNLSVIEPGQTPQVPIFGPPFKELLLSQGSSLPEIFFNAVTPSDLSALKEENRVLRNMILDRRHKCDWCEFTFPDYDADAKRAHFSEHAKQLAEGGELCPVCGSNKWLWMTTPQRREHLLADQDRREKATIKDFWKVMTCPICDKDLAHMKPELVLRHVASHNPDVLKFCDRCGRNQETLSVAERIWHTRMCVESEQAFYVRKFCNRCGLDLTTKTPKKLLKHSKSCHAIPLGDFCTKCALNLSTINPEDADVHKSDCREPAGPPKSFCTRCGIDRLSLSDAEAARHKQSCFMTDPRPKADAENILELERKVAELRQLRASLRKEQVQLYEYQESHGFSPNASPRKCPYCLNHVFPANITTEDIIKHFGQKHVPVATTANAPDNTQPTSGHPSRRPQVARTGENSMPHLRNDGSRTSIDATTIQAQSTGTASNTLQAGSSSPAQRNTESYRANVIQSTEDILCSFGGLEQCPYTLALPSPVAADFSDHWKRVHEPLKGTFACPFKSLTKPGEPCLLPMTYTSKPFESKQFENHVKEKHPITSDNIKCPFGATSLECNKNYSTAHKATAFVQHLVDKHVNGKLEDSRSGLDWSTACQMQSHPSGRICGQNLDSAQEVFDHIQSQHLLTAPELPATSEPNLAKIFTCFLETPGKESCGHLIDIPFSGNTDSTKNFLSHYQHTPRHGGPDADSIRLVLQESLDAANQQLKQHEEYMENLTLVGDNEALKSAQETQKEVTVIEKLAEDLRQRIIMLDNGQSREPVDPVAVHSESPVISPTPRSEVQKSGAAIRSTVVAGNQRTPLSPDPTPSKVTGKRKSRAPGQNSKKSTKSSKRTPVSRKPLLHTPPATSPLHRYTTYIDSDTDSAPADPSDPAEESNIDTTGFEPSPVEETFPPQQHGVKRKSAFELSDIPKRLSGETPQAYGNRLKKQKVAAANHVSVAGENEDESYRSRPSTRSRAAQIASVSSATTGTAKEIQTAPKKALLLSRVGSEDEIEIVEGLLLSPVENFSRTTRASSRSVDLVAAQDRSRRSMTTTSTLDAVPSHVSASAIALGNSREGAEQRQLDEEETASQKPK